MKMIKNKITDKEVKDIEAKVYTELAEERKEEVKELKSK